MIGAQIAEAVVGAASGIMGMSQSAKAAREAKNLRNEMKRENENWYAQRANQDYTQTAEALSKWNSQAEQVRKAVADAKGTDAIMGTNNAANVQASGLDSMGTLAAQQTATGESLKRDAEKEYLTQKNSINQAELASLEAQRQAGAQAAGQGFGAVGEIAASAMDEAYYKKNPFVTYPKKVIK